MRRYTSRPVVLSSIARTPTGNPFGEWLFSSLPGNVDTRWFTWRGALLGRYSIFHVHWPEYLFGSPRPARAVVKSLLGFALLARLFAFRTPVIQTVHTQKAYEDVGRIVKFQSRLLMRRTVFRIYLNESPENDLSDGTVILLGRYEAAPSGCVRTPGRTRLLFFGLLRAYKGIEDLLSAFRQIDGDSLELAVIGNPTDSEYAEMIGRLAELDPRVDLTARRVEDSELAFAVGNSDLVVLPYKTMYNSSALFFALDHRVPVLATHSPSNVAIQAEVGDAWLLLFRDVLTVEALTSAIDSLTLRARDREAPPDLRRRDWTDIGRLHASLYEFVLATPRRLRKPQDWRKHVRRCVEHDPSFQRHSILNRDDALVPR